MIGTSGIKLSLVLSAPTWYIVLTIYFDNTVCTVLPFRTSGYVCIERCSWPYDIAYEYCLDACLNGRQLWLLLGTCSIKYSAIKC